MGPYFEEGGVVQERTTQIQYGAEIGSRECYGEVGVITPKENRRTRLPN